MPESDFKGTFKVVFQPAEEQIGGGKAVAESGHLDDVDHLLAIHIGLDHPSGEIVAGIDGFLAVSHFEAEFTGAPRTRAGTPQQGDTQYRRWRQPYRTSMRFAGTVTAQRRGNAGVVEGVTAPVVSPEKRRWKARSAAKRRYSRST